MQRAIKLLALTTPHAKLISKVPISLIKEYKLIGELDFKPEMKSMVESIMKNYEYKIRASESGFNTIRACQVKY